MNKYVEKTIELIKSLEEEDVLEILLTEKKKQPVELIPFLRRDRITLGLLINKFRPEVVEKYKLLVDKDDDGKYEYD